MSKTGRMTDSYSSKEGLGALTHGEQRVKRDWVLHVVLPKLLRLNPSRYLQNDSNIGPQQNSPESISRFFTDYSSTECLEILQIMSQMALAVDLPEDVHSSILTVLTNLFWTHEIYNFVEDDAFLNSYAFWLAVDAFNSSTLLFFELQSAVLYVFQVIFHELRRRPTKSMLKNLAHGLNRLEVRKTTEKFISETLLKPRTTDEDTSLLDRFVRFCAEYLRYPYEDSVEDFRSGVSESAHVDHAEGILIEIFESLFDVTRQGEISYFSSIIYQPDYQRKLCDNCCSQFTFVDDRGETRTVVMGVESRCAAADLLQTTMIEADISLSEILTETGFSDFVRSLIEDVVKQEIDQNLLQSLSSLLCSIHSSDKRFCQWILKQKTLLGDLVARSFVVASGEDAEAEYNFFLPILVRNLGLSKLRITWIQSMLMMISVPLIPRRARNNPLSLLTSDIFKRLATATIPLDIYDAM